MVNINKLVYEIKNWHDFQHDKREGRKMTWIKLYADLLDNQEFMSLDNDAQLLLIKCWLLACENQGKLPEVPEIAWRLREKVDVLQKSFNKLTGFILVASKMSKSLAECQSSVPREEESREEKSAMFASFWETYPDRNGTKATKKASLEWWTKQPLDTLTMVLSKTKLYRKYIDSLDKDEFNGGISDPIRYLKNEKYKDELDVKVDVVDRLVIANELYKNDKGFYNLTKEEQNERINQYSK